MSRVSDLLVAVVAIVVVFATIFVALNEAGSFDDHEEAVDPGYVLFDAGNGETKWCEASSGTYASLVTDAAREAGYTVTTDGGMAVDGKKSTSIGGVDSSWRYYVWSGDAWSDVTSSFDINREYEGGDFAMGFYPEGFVPIETPDNMSSWTMTCGDAKNSCHQDAERSGNPGDFVWTKPYGGSYVDTTVLVGGGRVFVDGSGAWGGSEPPAVYCYDMAGNEQWRFEYKAGAGWECNTGALFGDSYYLPASNGNVYKIPVAGPGADDRDVKVLEVGNASHDGVVGHKNNTGPANLVYDSGVIYFGTSNGHVYCVDSDLNVIWKTAITGSVYYTAPTVFDGKVYMGAGDGALHVLDQVTGKLVEKYTFGQKTEDGNVVYGYMGSPVVSGDMMYVASNDMTDKVVVGCEISENGLKEKFRAKVGYLCAYILPAEGGVYAFQDKVMTFVGEDGSVKELITLKDTIKAPMTLVNGTEIYANSYSSGGNLYCLSLDGGIIGQLAQPSDVRQYSMSNIVVIDDMVFNGNDKGAFAYQGDFPKA